MKNPPPLRPLDTFSHIGGEGWNPFLLRNITDCKLLVWRFKKGYTVVVVEVGGVSLESNCNDIYPRTKVLKTFADKDYRDIRYFIMLRR